MLKAQIEQDLKTALLSGDSQRKEVLRYLKSAILYEEVAKNARETGLPDEAILGVISREVKKRNESADLYKQAGDTTRAEAELAEKAILETYLPAQLSDAELEKIVDEAVAQVGDNAQMGQVIGAVRQKVGSQANGGRIAAAVKNKLQG
jgi:uncharacterized protein YqeY